jgi:hypothetical protein
MSLSMSKSRRIMKKMKLPKLTCLGLFGDFGFQDQLELALQRLDLLL